MYLNCHSYYSLRYGTIAPEMLLKIGHYYGVKAMALTDINTTSACLDFVRLSSNYGIKPIIGVDFRNAAKQHFVLLAKNNKGFKNINDYLSNHLHHDLSFSERPPSVSDVFVIYPYQNAIDVKALNNNEFIGVSAKDLNRFRFSKYVNHLNKVVILETLSFRDKKDFNTHRLLRAIDNNTLLSKLPLDQQGSVHDIMKPPDAIIRAFKDFPQIITNTERLLEACCIDFDFSQQTPNNQESYTGNVSLDFRLLKKLTYEGVAYRYAKVNDALLDRITKELNIIKEKGFVSYFLINWKILKYARSKGYFYVGRGSGANSVVAYLLRITDVDPIELDLYFERFINLYRTNPPDFDLDFSWTDRDDITHFIFKRFKHTALITVYNTFKHKAAIRELGKVFGLPKHEIDVLASGRFNYNTLDELSKLVIVYSERIQGFPNYLGIHAGGIIISEKPIHYYTATFMPPKGFPTTQFDMVVAEDIGLYKFDILSQRGLGKIKDAVEIIKYNNPEDAPIDIHDIKRFKEDEAIKYLLKNAKVIGCFYVESPAMRMLLKKLQVDDYLGLVAASSVIRPGVAKSGMMREYIMRYRYPDRRRDAHPVLLEIMPETYGVMVYQEDVIKVAHYFAGLNLGEADMLRRGMSGKFRSRDAFLKVKDTFFENCKKSNKALSLTKEIWRQIESFAGYAFAKGHSASYAVESYQSLFLKACYPLEYMVATINNYGGFYQTEYYVHEARMHGGIIEAPCVNSSSVDTVIKGKSIYIGFKFLHAFEHKIGSKIVKDRQANGLFFDLDDFIDRVAIGIEQLIILIKINAFRFTGKNKKELLWEAHMKVSKAIDNEHEITLFKPRRKAFVLPELRQSPLEDAFDEMELLGYSLCSPFELLLEPLSHPMRAFDLVNNIGRVITVHGYLVTVKRTSTSNNKTMYFGTFLDVAGDFIDTVHFPPVATKYPFRGKGIYSITGKVMEEFDCLSVEVIKMERLPIIEDPRYSDKNISA
ncbi:DNA polymerase III subunit alpha [Aestuariibaculum sediminum]|uniref:DNA-directed DNA polymerase n=1 Tax=Aestuariibaculum sediminum TaxID=2770637 RepID=A0A8J6QBJ0_9FLAO|nr:DNA polymerase III subunit alpha [Aestuariibaculum sediminum]MBD0833001.1 DNA polymerase III subunit alpha [Aestuariibaculum sediminum]